MTMPIADPTYLTFLEKGGVLAFSVLVLLLLWHWKKEQATRDERHLAVQEKRDERHIVAAEKQATATAELAKSIGAYAAAQTNVAAELRDLTGEVRQVRDEIRSCEVDDIASKHRNDVTVVSRKRGGS